MPPVVAILAMPAVWAMLKNAARSRRPRYTPVQPKLFVCC
jgi:hypothetical protein